MLRFKLIRWRNLNSFGNQWTTIILDSCAMTLFQGASGGGKSSMLDAVCLALYGRPFRNVSKTKLINNINDKECLVELHFDVDDKSYVVRRGMKPTVFEITRDGEVLPQDAHAADYQAQLETIIGMNFKTFVQSVVLGAAGTTPFMQLPKAERRVVVENFLDLEPFGKMAAMLKLEAGELQQSLIQLRSEKNGLDSELRLRQDAVVRLKGMDSDMVSRRVQLKDQLLTDIVQLERDKQKVGVEVLGTDTICVLAWRERVEKLRDEVQQQLATLTNAFNSKQRELAFYDKHDSCPTCGQQIALEFKTEKQSKLRALVTKIDAGLKRGREKLEGHKTELLLVSDEDKRIQAEKALIAKYDSQIYAKQCQLKTIEDEIAQANKVSAGAIAEEIARIDALIVRLADVGHKIDLLEADASIQQAAVQVLKDDGIKAQVIRRYIPAINQHVNRFLQAMQFFVYFKLDENFEEEVRARARDVSSYYSFSEGEKQRLDLAILFTWRQISKMKNSIRTNLLVIDELVDSYLDHDATENVIQLLRTEVFKDTNIFVISHKNSVSDKFDRVLHFEKVKDFSVLKG